MVTYLPDIMSGVVDRVNAFFESSDDPFSVTFDHGLYNQVGNDKLISGTGFLMVWLVMPYLEDIQRPEVFADVSARLIIAVPTDANYTMQQREEINIFPRLIPVYDRLIEEIKAEEMFGHPIYPQHKRQILPYWAGGDAAAPGQPNLWKNYVDCIDVKDLKLEIVNPKNCTFLSSF